MIDLHSVTLQQLRYLDAVAQGSTFSEAADDLYVSQSALSQGLGRLEALVGTDLFEIDGRRRRLTDAGRRVAAVARRMLAEADRLAADLEDRAAGRRGRLRLGMIDAAALYQFPEAVAAFRDAHPDVEVVITVRGSDDCLDRLAGYHDDLAIVVAPADGFATEVLAEEEFAVYGPDRRPQPGDPWVLYPASSHTRALIDTGLAAAAIRPRVVGESGNPDVLRQLAVLNGAWTVLPEAVGSGAEGAGLMRGERVMVRPIVAARRLQAPPQPLVEAFLDVARR